MAYRVDDNKIYLLKKIYTYAKIVSHKACCRSIDIEGECI